MTKTYDIRDVRNEASMSFGVVNGGFEIEIEDGNMEIHFEMNRTMWMICRGSEFRRGTWIDGGILNALRWALEARNELDQERNADAAGYIGSGI